jgi:hypothetical protein
MDHRQTHNNKRGHKRRKSRIDLTEERDDKDQCDPLGMIFATWEIITQTYLKDLQFDVFLKKNQVNLFST